MAQGISAIKQQSDIKYTTSIARVATFSDVYDLHEVLGKYVMFIAVNMSV